MDRSSSDQLSQFCRILDFGAFRYNIDQSSVFPPDNILDSSVYFYVLNIGVENL